MLKHLFNDLFGLIIKCYVEEGVVNMGRKNRKHISKDDKISHKRLKIALK